MQKFGGKFFGLPAVEAVGHNTIAVRVERQQIDADLILFGVLHTEIVTIGGLDPVEADWIGQRLGLCLFQVCRPFQIECIEADVDFEGIRCDAIGFDGAFEHVIVQPVANTNIFEFFDDMREDGFQFIHAAGRSVFLLVVIEWFALVHRTDATFCVFLTTVVFGGCEQRQRDIVKHDARFVVDLVDTLLLLFIAHLLTTEFLDFRRRFARKVANHFFYLQFFVHVFELLATNFFAVLLVVEGGEEAFAILQGHWEQDAL